MPDLLSTGTLIADRYFVADHCNAGGQSWSFIGEDRQAVSSRDKKVFLKQYLDVPPGSEEARRMPEHFRRFRERLAEKHNYLCLPKDILTTHNSVVAVFPFLNGKDLQSLMGEGLDEPQCARFAISIANAVRIIHRAGIVHLDLKPDNIVIEHSERLALDFVHLIDLDAATIDGEGLRSDLIGTPMYMSPEHLDSRRFGPPSEKSDVFTLGIILFQLLFGRHPFDGVEDYSKAVFRREFAVPETAYHKDVVSRIVSCLNPDPARRPKSGWVHSTLHSHYTSGFVAPSPSDRWISNERYRESVSERDVREGKEDAPDQFIEISSVTNRRFRRRYVEGHVVTNSDFRGSGLSGLPAEVFMLLFNGGFWGIEGVAASRVSVDGRSLDPGVRVGLEHGSRIRVGSEEFLVSLREAIPFDDSPDMRIAAGEDDAKKSDPHELPFLARLFSRLRG